MSLLLPMKNNDSDIDLDVDIEYVPCVASFDSYLDEDTQQPIRYLLSVNYHGSDGTHKNGSSLAPFFDEAPDQEHYLGILGVAIGAGIEELEDTEKLRQFFQTLQGANNPLIPAPSTGEDSPSDGDDGDKQQPQPIPPLMLHTIRPSPEYVSMKEETDAFRTLSVEEKDEAAIEGTIGPGKMARFAHTFATRLVRELVLEERRMEEEKRANQQQVEKERIEQKRQAEEQAHAEKVNSLPIQMDESKPRYACRTCRTILFSEGDQENPPHAPAKHKFSMRKVRHGGIIGGDSSNTSNSACQSYFLAAQGLDWMGDMSAQEGRISCPKCSCKVGTWNWSGAQCSCGTWVAPALRIPKSKVDVIGPTL